MILLSFVVYRNNYYSYSLVSGHNIHSFENYYLNDMKIRIFIFLASVLISIRLNAQDSIKFVLAQTIDNIGANDIVLADFNNDSNIDAFIVNGVWNKPLPSKLWINNGTGHFTDSKQDIGNAKSWSVVFGHLSGDGYLDIFIANGDWEKGDSSHLWINNGHGKFACSSSKFGKANSSSAAIGDLNGDGKPDIFVANHPYSNGQGGEDEVWFNNGKGNFINSGQKLGGSDAARRIKLADINGDGNLDATVLNGDTNRIWLNNGKGQFLLSKQNIGVGENIDLAIGDLDNDGDLDMIIAKGAWGKTPKGIEVWTNDGKGKFSKTQNIGDFNCYGLASVDFTHDGYLDLVLVNGTDQPNQIFLNDKNGHFYDSKIKIGNGGNKVAVVDLNHDNLVDVIIVGNETTGVYLQTNKKK